MCKWGARQSEARDLGEKLARLRMARQWLQADAAARAGLSRSTAILIEKGDPGRTLAQILRYLEAIAPGLPLLNLLQETDPSLTALAAPDAWGRRVIEARRKVPANTLSEAYDLLAAGGDRVGALDVRPSITSPDSPSASDPSC